jgi:hypothetical protein
LDELYQAAQPCCPVEFFVITPQELEEQIPVNSRIRKALEKGKLLFDAKEDAVE